MVATRASSVYKRDLEIKLLRVDAQKKEIVVEGNRVISILNLLYVAHHGYYKLCLLNPFTLSFLSLSFSFSLWIRIQPSRPSQNVTSCRGIRLANITDGPSVVPNKKPSPSPFRVSPFGLSRSVTKRSSLLDSDSDSDEEHDILGPLDGDTDSNMDLDEPEPSSVSMATGITHDHPYAWALDGRVTGSNEGNGMPGHIHVSTELHVSYL